MQISEYQERVDKWIRSIGVRYFNELTNTVILTEEVGEFARLVARVYGEQSFREGTEPQDHKAALADEMADIFFVLTCLANQMEIDLANVLQGNLEKKSTRDESRHSKNPKL